MLIKNCKLCGRPLKSNNSRQLGYGPVCFKRAGFIKKKGKLIKKLNKY